MEDTQEWLIEVCTVGGSAAAFDVVPHFLGKVGQVPELLTDIAHGASAAEPDVQPDVIAVIVDLVPVVVVEVGALGAMEERADAGARTRNHPHVLLEVFPVLGGRLARLLLTARCTALLGVHSVGKQGLQVGGRGSSSKGHFLPLLSSQKLMLNGKMPDVI